MDYITLQQLKSRGIIAEKYNVAMGLIKDIRSLVTQYEKNINISLEEAEDLYDVSEANMDAAHGVLGTVKDKLQHHLDK